VADIDTFSARLRAASAAGVAAGAALGLGAVPAGASPPITLAAASAPHLSKMPPGSAATAKRATRRRRAARPRSSVARRARTSGSSSSLTSPLAPAFYTVAPGDSLWVIADRFVKPPKTDERINAFLHRIWDRNSIRIGTGDPNLIFPGQRLSLPG
jgi:nucleoid-associated protein YgaU